MSIHISGRTGSRRQAEEIARLLQADGCAPTAISVSFPDQRESRDFAEALRIAPPEPAARTTRTGGMLSGLLGWAMGIGGLGWMVGVGTLVMPGVKPFNTITPLIAALTGPMIGAAIGGIVGILLGLVFARRETARLAAIAGAAGIVIAVEARDHDQAGRIDGVLVRAGAIDVVNGDGSAVGSVRSLA